ncbi:MAG: ABC transporter substrate-binding protein [Deltaproteobacteria bacterium]|nr:ABC transporter substrate-binding protein [Deltaproteobacteria bacterium]MBI3076066.1 ABC transporter substrate-binding protein [Deltaproteobacteria bacterium]
MKMKTHPVVWFGLVFLGLALAALGLAPAASAQGLAKWKTGIVEVKADSAFEYIAVEKGYYRELGVDAELVPIRGGVNIVKALLAGHVDAIEMGPGPSLVAIEKGAKIKVVGAALTGMPHVLYVRKEINSVRDLVGRVVITSSVGALPYELVTGLLDKHGIGLDKVRFLAGAEEADRVRSVIAGRADVAASSIEFKPLIAQHPDVKVLLSFAREFPNWVRMTVIASEKNIQERPEVVTKVLTAHAKGIRYALAHRDETVALMAKLARRQHAQEVDWLYDFFVENQLLEPNLYVSPEAVNFLQQLNVKTKRQSRVLPLDQVATWEFQKKAVATLGEYRR